MVEESPDVLFDIAGPVATLTLNRPAKLNAVTPRMTDAIRGHADRINAESGIRVVILTGAGEKAFCAGSDISELDAYDTAWEFRGRPDYCDAIRSIRKAVDVRGHKAGVADCYVRRARDQARLDWRRGSIHIPRPERRALQCRAHALYR